MFTFAALLTKRDGATYTQTQRHVLVAVVLGKRGLNSWANLVRPWHRQLAHGVVAATYRALVELALGTCTRGGRIVDTTMEFGRSCVDFTIPARIGMRF